jgi:hypothetical protein
VNRSSEGRHRLSGEWKRLPNKYRGFIERCNAATYSHTIDESTSRVMGHHGTACRVCVIRKKEEETGRKQGTEKQLEVHDSSDTSR